MYKMQCVNGSASQTSWKDQLEGPAVQTSWTDQLDRPAKQTSRTDQLDGQAGQTRWMDQFFLFEALASSNIRIFSFQFIHCCSFRVWQRPCFLIFCVLLSLYFLNFSNNLQKYVTSGWKLTWYCKNMMKFCIFERLHNYTTTGEVQNRQTPAIGTF